MDISTADLMDERHDLECCDLQLRQFGGRTRFAGPVRTVRCYEDFSLVRQLLHEPGAGAVLVVDGGGSLHAALLGDRMAAAGVHNEWSGVVIAGAVRDTAALASMNIGIKALGTSPRRSAADGVGEMDVPVSFGGATFVPGAYLWSDDDGVVVSPDERRHNWP